MSHVGHHVAPKLNNSESLYFAFSGSFWGTIWCKNKVTLFGVTLFCLFRVPKKGPEEPSGAPCGAQNKVTLFGVTSFCLFRVPKKGPEEPSGLPCGAQNKVHSFRSHLMFVFQGPQAGPRGDFWASIWRSNKVTLNGVPLFLGGGWGRGEGGEGGVVSNVIALRFPEVPRHKSQGTRFTSGYTGVPTGRGTVYTTVLCEAPSRGNGRARARRSQISAHATCMDGAHGMQGWEGDETVVGKGRGGLKDSGEVSAENGSGDWGTGEASAIPRCTLYPLQIKR
jgi:hypothetical protein